MKKRVLILSTMLIAILAPAWAQVPDPSRGDAVQPGLSAHRNKPGGSMGTVTGTVLTVTGAAVRDAHVEIRELTGRLVASGYSLPNGSFEFANVPRGHYEVVARSGIQESRQQLDLDGGVNQVHLRIAPAEDDAAAGQNSISVAEMKIPEKARKAAQRAEEAFSKHKLEDARKEIAKALQIAPQYARALTMQGVLALNDNKFDEACQLLETAIKSDARFGMAYLVLGAVYNAQEHYDDALRVLRQGLSLTPTSWQGYFESAKALLAKAQFAEALRDANRAAQLAASAYPAIHLVRAQAFLGLKNYSDAVTELEQYLGGEPNGLDSAQARKTLNDVRAFMAQQKK